MNPKLLSPCLPSVIHAKIARESRGEGLGYPVWVTHRALPRVGRGIRITHQIQTSDAISIEVKEKM